MKDRWKRAGIACLWVIPVILAFAMGRMIAARPDGPAPLAKVQDSDISGIKSISQAKSLHTTRPAPLRIEPASEKSAVAEHGPERAPDILAYQETSKDLQPVERIDQLLNKALLNHDPLERSARFTQVLNNLNQWNVHEAVATFERLPLGCDREREFHLLLYQWGQMNGEAAARYVTQSKNKDTQNAAFHVFSGWAGTDYESALTWAREHNKGPDHLHLVGIIDGVAKFDLSLASDLVSELPHGRSRGKAAGIVIDGYLQQGRHAVTRWVTDLPASDQVRDGIVGRVARELAQENPKATANWVHSLENKAAKEQAAWSLISTWSRSDPREATDWANTLDEGSQKGVGISIAIGNWARKEPVEAAEWMLQFPPTPDMDRAVRSFVYRIRRTHPEVAIAWAEQISDEKEREKLIKSLVDGRTSAS